MISEIPPTLDLPIRAAIETAISHGVTPDRCDILQNGSTLVLRLSDSLVARVVTDLDGPRQGTGWFERENAVAQHLAQRGAPVIPMHPGIPSGPHEHLGYTLNFWQYVTSIDEEAEPERIGRTLYQCHEILRDFVEPLPQLAILTESLSVLEMAEQRGLFPQATIHLLHGHLTKSIELLADYAFQPLHGDAHPGNLMNTTLGLLWTDWEDTFSGPVEWDLASIIWNSRVLEEDLAMADGILDAYRKAGGKCDPVVLHQCLIARAAVMCAWYPILYPEPNPVRQMKLKIRLDWLEKIRDGH